MLLNGECTCQIIVLTPVFHVKVRHGETGTSDDGFRRERQPLATPQMKKKGPLRKGRSPFLQIFEPSHVGTIHWGNT